MAKVRYENFTDRAADSFYPFISSLPYNIERDLQLPAGAIIDAALHIPGSFGHYTLTRLITSGDRIIVQVTDESGAIAAGEWTLSQPNSNCVDLYTSDNSHAGMLFVSSSEFMKLLTSLRSGSYVFESSTAVFAPATYHYVPASGISVASDANGIRVSPDEDIIFRGHNGVYLECVGDEIKIHVVGDPRGRRAVCEGTFVPETFIREVIFQKGEQTIRCAPDDGNIRIMVVSGDDESALRVTHQNNQMKFDLLGLPD